MTILVTNGDIVFALNRLEGLIGEVNLSPRNRIFYRENGVGNEGLTAEEMGSEGFQYARSGSRHCEQIEQLRHMFSEVGVAVAE